ncbi:hypothetical protein [Tepidibacter hydrothermalis]|uniref:Phage protein n=1 Tax=Tepidibacter hydrothermalis TaxID=3036126 RepID=A0ABY8EA20_9FIRM|nr:hypothetical protein [Tepidibacter hydrothermalis]WFD09744.1 hypothetical protein P4S50_15305 [Tepidibacter hydrothermalis]
MGIKKHGDYDFERMRKDMPNLDFVTFKCPHCTDKEGNFAKIVLYVPKDDEYKIATQCNCNGQEDRCAFILTLMKTYNNEKMLKKLEDTLTEKSF